jgi:hypothetical protein
MPVDLPVITKLVISPGRDAFVMDNARRSLPMSIGVILDDSRVFWGDLELIQRDVAGVDKLLELITPCIRGQSAASFRHLNGKIREAAISEEQFKDYSVFRRGLQDALLAAVAYENKQTVAQTLAAEYGVTAFETSFRPPIYLEVSDAFASAALLDHTLSQFPDGIGYCLTGERTIEAIGREGQLLQRFVRQLTHRASLVSAEPDYYPDFYLRLNGALGHLVQSDPVNRDAAIIRNIGKVLGNVVGLQAAAGNHRLVLEEPILLADPIVQMAHLKMLGDMLRQRLKTGSDVRPAQLTTNASRLGQDVLPDYIEVGIVDNLRIDLNEMSDPDSLYQLIAAFNLPSAPILLAIPSHVSTRSSCLAAAAACAFQVQALILNFDSGSNYQLMHVKRYLSESSIDLRLNV